jgi:hypothetical protein
MASTPWAAFLRKPSNFAFLTELWLVASLLCGKRLYVTLNLSQYYIEKSRVSPFDKLKTTSKGGIIK